MATWYSRKDVKFSRDMGMSYAECSQSWEYGTTSDYLRITTKQGAYSDFSYHEPSTDDKTYSKEEALALLETLMDWANRYEGVGEVDDILKRVRGE